MDEARSNLGLVGLFYLGRRDLREVDRIGGFGGPFLLVASAVSIILSAQFVLMGIDILSGNTGRELSAAEGTAAVALLVVPGILLTAVMLRSGFCGVLVEDGQVEIRNPLRSSRHPVDQVVRFEDGWVETAELSDGSRVRLWGLAMWFGVNRRPKIAGLAELNRRLVSERAAAS